MSRESAYVPLVFAGIEDEFERVFREDGSLDDAIRDLAVRDDVIVHVHWEEFVLRHARTDAEADEATETFVRQIAEVRALGGPIVWTVHNEVPHVIGFRRQFLELRRTLASYADAILVHNAESIDVLARQVALDRSRVHLLAHPSYLGVHEDDATLRAELHGATERRIQGFGWIRLQKGFAEMIDMLPAAYLRARDATVRISGSGPQAEAVIASRASRTDVEWDVRHVPHDDVPALLRTAACVILPYERVLTSGVALLAMSVGAIVVAVDIPQMRELLPQGSRRFLFARSDGAALRAIIDDVLSLGEDERRAMIDANVASAREVHPAIVSRRLAGIYRGLGARG